MKKYLLPLLLLVSSCIASLGATVDYRSLLPQYFTTNIPSAYYIGLKTNLVVTFPSVNTNYLSTNGYILSINTNAIIGLELWKTNTAEGGIMYTNGDDSGSVAKFSANVPGTFESGYIFGSAIIKANSAGATAIGLADTAPSSIIVDQDGGFASGSVQNGGRLHVNGSGSFRGGSIALGVSDRNGLTDAQGSGNMVGGYSDFGGKISTTSDDRGCFVWGNVEQTNSIITADHTRGALAFGVAFDAGTIKSAGYGSIAGGYCVSRLGLVNGGTIWADDNGTMAFGAANEGSLIKANGEGAFATGATFDYSTISANLGFAGGYASSNSTIVASGVFNESGMFAYGYADTNGFLKSEGFGSLATGAAVNSGIVDAAGTGHQQLGGEALDGGGNVAHGFSTGSGSKILSFGSGSFASGIATNGQYLSATGQVAVTFGKNVGNESSGYAFAFGKDFTNRTANTFNVGWSQYPNLIVSQGALQIATNALSNWPTSAASPGGAAFCNSNATVYLLTSSPGSTTWAATNAQPTTKVWRGLLTQASTAAPTAVVLENSLGTTITWARSSTGIYTATATGVFTTNKTFYALSWNYESSSLAGAKVVRTSTDVITISTINDGFTDGILSGTPFEILIYP